MSAAPPSPDADWASLELPRPRLAMPVVGDWVTPWIAAASLVAVLTGAYVVGGSRLPLFEQSMLAISLCATLTAAVLVVLRSKRTRALSAREERSRPAAETLDGPGGSGPGGSAYVHGMQRWTATVLELLEHARGRAEQGSTLATELDAALMDTRELHQLLATSAPDDLSLHEAATMHAVCTLWESNQERVERLAASSDPEWHRRWRARAVADRLLRHGASVSDPMVIPYRT